MAQKMLSNFTPPGSSESYKFRAGALFYGTTSNSTTAMTVSIPGVTEYYIGLTLILTMGAQAASGCTLNVNSLGAKPMKYGASASGTYFTSGATYLFVYDGTNFTAIHSYNSNTTYSSMSVSEGTTGTATTQRTLTAANLKGIINAHAPTKTGTGASGTWGISVTGNAATATQFASNTNVTLTGDVVGSSSSKRGWNLDTTIQNGAVTNEKLANSYFTIKEGSTDHNISLGGQVLSSDLANWLGLNKIMSFIGISNDTKLVNGYTGTPTIADGQTNYSNKTPGDTVVKGTSGVQYIWTGNSWYEVGSGLLYDLQGTAAGLIATLDKSDSDGGTNNFVSVVTQTDGKIAVTHKSLNTSGTWSGKATTAGTADTAKAFTAAKDVTLTGDVTGSASSTGGWSVATTLANSGVTAGTYGPTANVTGSNGTTIVVPQIMVDSKGRVTAVTNRTYTSVNNTYTLSGLGGIGTITATGTAPLTLSASKSGTTVTITGSVAAATTSAAGLMSAVDKKNVSYFVIGTQTAATNAWTGTCSDISTLYDGLTIRYYLPYAGNGSGTTLSLNSGTAYPVYRYGRTTQITTHFPAGSIITMTFRTSYSVSGTAYTNAWIVDAYYDSNNDYYQRLYASTTNAEYPITTRYNTTTGSSYYAEYGRYSTGVTLNPSTNTITATKFVGALQGNADTATNVAWSGVTGKPSTFAPSAHTHNYSKANAPSAHSYTPAGTISTPTITVAKTMANVVNASFDGEILVLTATSVMTNATATSSTPAFTGTAASLTHSMGYTTTATT